VLRNEDGAIYVPVARQIVASNIVLPIVQSKKSDSVRAQVALQPPAGLISLLAEKASAPPIR